MSEPETPYVAWTAQAGHYADPDGGFVRRATYDLQATALVAAHAEINWLRQQLLAAVEASERVNDRIATLDEDLARLANSLTGRQPPP